jgi:hypothetical protein
MQRQLLINGAIVVLALSTLGVVFATQHAPTTSELESRKNKLLPSWQKESVTRIVMRRKAQVLELTRASADAGVEGDFRIVKPWSERADIATVSSLLGSLDLASALRPADGVSREQAGLARPELQIELTSAGKVLRLVFGGAAPSPAGARYAEVVTDGASRLYTLSQGLLAELDLPFDKFRETRLLEQGRSEIAKLTLEGRGSHVTLLQRERGQIYLQAGGPPELADHRAADMIFTALSRLTSEHFLDPEQARALLGSDPLRLTLELREAGAPNVTLAFGGDCQAQAGSVVMLREQAGKPARAGCVPAELAHGLELAPAALPLLTPCAAREDEVEELRIVHGSAKLEMARKGDAFALRSPAPGEVALDAGNQRIGAIARARAERIAAPNLAALGLEPAAGEVELRLVGGELGLGEAEGSGIRDQGSERGGLRGDGGSERLLVGAVRGDGSLCVQRVADKVVLCVDAEAAPAFQPDASLLKGLGVLAFSPSELTRFTIDGPGRSERLRHDSDGSYQLETPSGFRHDGALVADTVQTLGTLQAERWVAPSDDGHFGLASAQLHVTLELGSGASATRRELRVGSAAQGGFYATLTPDPGVFVLARSSVVTLQTPLIDRELCPLAKAELGKIELRAGSRKLTLERHGEAWQGQGISPARALELVETVSALRADSAIHVGAAKPAEGLEKPALTLTLFGLSGKSYRLLVGAGDTLEGARIFYTRLDSVDATFSLAQSAVSALQDF